MNIDLEPSVVDEVRKGPYQRLFQPDTLISGKEDAADNFARGYYTIGKQDVNHYLNTIQKQVEKCSNLQGFLLVHSLGGGTGSGLGSLLLRKLSDEYEKKTKVNFSIFPSPQMGASVVEPYNSVLASRILIEESDLTVMFDNESLYRVSCDQLGIESPSFGNINRLIARTISSLTSAQRFPGPINGTLREYVMNLVPYKTVHFLVPSLAPLVPEDESHRHWLPL